MEVYSMMLIPPVVDRIYQGLLLMGIFIFGYTIIGDFILGYLRRSIEGKKAEGVSW